MTEAAILFALRPAETLAALCYALATLCFVTAGVVGLAVTWGYEIGRATTHLPSSRMEDL